MYYHPGGVTSRMSRPAPEIRQKTDSSFRSIFERSIIMKKFVSVILAVLLIASFVTAATAEKQLIAIPNDGTNEARALLLLRFQPTCGSKTRPL